MSRRGPRLRHRFEYGAFLAASAVAGALPEGMASRLGAWAGRVAGSGLRIRRRDTEAHLAIAFPDRPEPWRSTIAVRSYEHLGREAVFLARARRMPTGEISSRVRLVGFDAVREASARGGVVLLTGHLGNWEIAGAAIAASGTPLDVVGKGMANERFERVLFATRAGLGMRVIEIADAPKEVLRALGGGRVVAMLADQNAHRQGIFLPFFGRPAATSRGPALFALRSGAPVFVGFAIRDPGRGHHYTLEAKALTIERSPDLERDVVALLGAYNAELERAIRANPEQYFWQHRRWRTRPSEEPPYRR